MRTEQERNRLFTRRAALLAGGKLALFSVLVGRMYYLQVVESDRYLMLADENRINLRLLPPPRGRILDRFGTPLAVNQRNYRAVVIPEQAGDVAATLEAIGALVPLAQGDRLRVLGEVGHKRGFVPIVVREDLSWEEVSRIEVNAPDLPGVMVEVGGSRYYPYKASAAHVVGYVAAVSEAELTGDPLLELPDFRIGKSGIERVYDLALRGKGGASEVEVNALGRVVKELSRRQGEPGRDVVLTLDMALQRSVGARLEGQSAAAVVMDIHTGDVLAMAASPGFDPNEFNRGLSIESWRDLLSDPRAPLVNKAIAGQYAPGSTFKMVVALAALEGGVVGPGHRVLCTGEIEFGGSRFHGWKRGGHGLLAMVEAIKQSCDIYFYDVALRTGVDRIAGMARRLGLGQKLGINLPGEQPGVIPTRDWKLATLGTPWQQGETLITGIGQGFVLATPLQLAVMMARLVNGGFAVVPRLSRDPVEPGEARADPQPAFESLGVSSVALAILREAMDGVVNHPLGTAYKARIEEVGLAMGGKTGTSQVRRISKSEREKGVIKNRDRPWWERDHAVFIGYAPLEAPRYVAAVVVEHGGSGAAVAAPIAHDILLEVQLRDPSRAGPASPLAGVGAAGREL